MALGSEAKYLVLAEGNGLSMTRLPLY